MGLRRRTTWLLVGLVVVVLIVAGATGLALSRGDGSTSAADPVEPAPRIQRYVALGDSYTAAPGVPRTDTADPCLRSTSSYPKVVASALDPVSYADVSCSGARTADLAGRQTAGDTPLAPQYAALTPDTDVVTLGMGGNDFGIFGTLVGACTFVRFQDPTGSPCRTAMRSSGADRLLGALPRVERRMARAVREIRRRSPDAQVLVVGYPQIVPATGTCPALLPLATGDYPYTRTVNRGLDDALEDAARATGATYVDVWSASAGHDVCAADPWVNGRSSDTGRAAPYHPFAVEQRAVAGLVTRLVEQRIAG